MGTPLPVTRLVAEFAADRSLKLPKSARNVIAMSCLDWLAVGIAGRSEPVSRIVRSVMTAEGSAGQAHVFGAPQPMAPRPAAMINGTVSHALDYDDTHFDHIGHPSTVMFSAAMALGEQEQLRGADVLDAALIGAEVSVRVGTWLGAGHYDAGFHQTATAGAVGAAACAGRLLGLDAEQLSHAIGLLATRASGLKSQFGTMGKPFNAGLAASNGIEAALLAQSGFVSRTDGLEAPQGLSDSHHGENQSDAFDGFAEEFRFERVQHKYHACCHGIHAALEAIRNADLSAPPEKLVLSTHPKWMTVCNKPSAQTGLEAKFSYKVAIAMALSGLDTAALDTFSDDHAKSGAFDDLAARIKVQPSEDVPDTAALIDITLADGTRQTLHHDLSDLPAASVRQNRVLGKAKSLLGADAADRLWREICKAGGPELAALAKAMIG